MVVALGLLLQASNEGIEAVVAVVMHTSLNTHLLCKCSTLDGISEPCRFLREYFDGGGDADGMQEQTGCILDIVTTNVYLCTTKAVELGFVEFHCDFRFSV